MAGRNVNVFITDFQVLAVLTAADALPDLRVTISADWTGADDLPHSDTRTVKLSTILKQLTAEQRKALVTDLIWRAVRLIVGIDDDVMV
jgi:hypothetical protein